MFAPMFRRAAVLLALAPACGDFDAAPQPGADDPTARPWELAGDWYPTNPDDLDDAVGDLLGAVDGEPRAALALLTPHASLPISGPTAAEVFARAELADRIILLAPDHWGDGAPAAIWTEGPWLVPGHAIEIDRGLVDELRDALPDLAAERTPFENHEEEMQLPFLQHLRPDATIAPIALTDNSRRHFEGWEVDRIQAWGDAIAGIVAAHRDAGEDVMLLVTTDLTHHETRDVGDQVDAALMDRIGALDVEGLFDDVTADRITICGEVPTAILMAALRALGRDSIDVIGRGSSYFHDEDADDVVGYPAAAAWR
jgi:hypothetical protein